MTSPTSIDLNQACALLKSESTTDNVRWFVDVYENDGFTEEDNLTDYICHIQSDARSWASAFPAKIVALNTFKKAKTALLALFALDKVNEALGVELVTKGRESVDTVFNDKAFMKSIVKERKNAALVEAETVEAPPLDDRCRRLEHENKVLRQALVSLTRDLPAAAQAICILIDGLCNCP
jgi:flavin-binding protein dodecin